MSYSSENTLPIGIRIQDVRDFCALMGYRKSAVLKSEELGEFEEYWWFEEKDYQSWSGVELSLHRTERIITVSTRTTIARSYFDLSQQNNTISAIRKRFGGTFTTDAGRGRYLRPSSGPTPAPASGCYLAFSRFGLNLIKAKICHEARTFPNHPQRKCKGIEIIQELDPRTLANNTLVPFLVAAMEDYFKSTFIALLTYSTRKDAFLKSIRLQGEQLAAISSGDSTVEEQISETLSFQRLSALSRHFETLDPKLDLAGALRRPYRRRSQSLFDSLEALVLCRHEFIHRATVDISLTDERIMNIIYDLDEAITRVYRRITDHYNWIFQRSWYLGIRYPRKKAAATAA